MALSIFSNFFRSYAINFQMFYFPNFVFSSHHLSLDLLVQTLSLSITFFVHLPLPIFGTCPLPFLLKAHKYIFHLGLLKGAFVKQDFLLNFKVRYLTAAKVHACSQKYIMETNFHSHGRSIESTKNAISVMLSLWLLL